ncbi:hypothetical protein BVRB_6g144600 [Beta vulgaris subsp. vulgaris]|nr:hypothetical protein BVRB_6g144600 [Beta vulgaris subsp. vulgaris]
MEEKNQCKADLNCQLPGGIGWLLEMAGGLKGFSELEERVIRGRKKEVGLERVGKRYLG